MVKATESESESKSTAIAVIDRNRFAALVPNSEAREAMLANLGPGERLDEQDLVRVPIPTGGGTKWNVADVTGEHSERSIEGVLAFVGYRRILWPSQVPTGEPPVCVSLDLERGIVRGELPADLIDKWKEGDGVCEDCPFNQFGSSANGHGKRCKEVRLLFLLREGDAFPILVNVAPGSLKGVRRFVKRLPVVYWRAIVSLELTKTENKDGIAYSQVAPTLVGVLDAEAGELVKRYYTEVIGGKVASVEVRQEDIEGGDGGEE